MTMITKSSKWYAERPETRALVQAVPIVGGSLDTIFSEPGRRIREKRLEHFIHKTTIRLKQLEDLCEINNSEELFDLTVQILESVMQTRSSEKRERFAKIFSRQLKKQSGWEEAETATRFLNDLSDLHIVVLKIALSTPECSSPFEGLKVITLRSETHGSDGENPPLKLLDVMEGYSLIALQMVCSELVSKGLLHDESSGRYGGAKALDYLVATDLAQWFMDWVQLD